MRPNHIALAAMVFTIPVSDARAQQSSEAHARNNCRLAEQVLATGHPAPHTEWAIRVIPGCGARGGQAVSAFLQRTRRATESGPLDRLVESVWGMRDSRIFATALSIAGDATSSEYARLQSIRILSSLVTANTHVSVDQIGKNPRVIEGITDVEPTSGDPLPGDYLATMASSLSRIVADPGATAELREAARFVEAMARRRMDRG
ncbi:MAG TPA: hypothetical protein VFJ16_30130 [Longimicrobium sp.]|nr:hypothetical protein [Longimicrobium sp.]